MDREPTKMGFTMELNWVNKHLVLYYDLDEQGNPGKPIWVSPGDPRLARSAQLQLEAEYGTPITGNMLIRGDNLLALRALAREYRDDPPVDCIYIDPPYNTANAFERYDDNFEHSEWLSLMYQRIIYLRELLQPGGVMFVQIDDHEHAYLEVLLDEVFDRNNKLATIIWRRRQSQANLAKIATIHDYILVYARDASKVDPSKKIRLNSTIWENTDEYGYNQSASKEIAALFESKTVFDTPKPELLVYNILTLATEPGDLVLDCFLGSGTTAAVAHKMGRRWIGVEMGTHAESLCLTRLQQVIEAQEAPNEVGISQCVNWKGGGGFGYYHVVPVEKSGDQSLLSHETNKKQQENTQQNNRFDYFQGTLGLIWPHKFNPLLLEFDRQGTIIGGRWASEGDISRLVTSGFLPANTNERDLHEITFMGHIKEGSHLINGDPLHAIRTLSHQMRGINHSKRPQAMFFQFPAIFQDTDASPLTDAQVLSFVREYLTNIRPILKDRGVFVSHILGRNYARLKILHDEILGRKNYLATLIWRNAENSKTEKKSPINYILLYAKDGDQVDLHKFAPTPELYINPDSDPRGPWESRPLVASEKSTNKAYTFTFPNGTTLHRKWRYAQEKLEAYVREDRIHFTNPKTGEGIPRLKVFFADRLAKYERTGEGGKTPNSLWTDPATHGTTKHLFEKLLEVVSQRGDLIGGFGNPLQTLLLEAAHAGRRWIGIPTDPGERLREKVTHSSWRVAPPVLVDGHLNFSLPGDVLVQGVMHSLKYYNQMTLQVDSGTLPREKAALDVHVGRVRNKTGILILAERPTLIDSLLLRDILVQVIHQFPAANHGKVQVLTNCGVQVPLGWPVEVIKLPYALIHGQGRRRG